MRSDMGGHLVCHKPCGAQYLTKTEQQCDTDRIALLFYADYVMESTLYQSKCKEIAEKSKKTRRKPEENRKALMLSTYRFTIQQNTILPNGNETFRFTATRHFLCIALFRQSVTRIPDACLFCFSPTFAGVIFYIDLLIFYLARGRITW